MSQHWSQLPERGTLGALRLISWIGIHIGRWAGRLLLYPISLYFLLTATAARRGSLLYLRRVLADKPNWTHVFRHIHCFAATILDRMFLLAGQCERFDVRIHNGELIQQQVDSGQGCVLLGSHLGSFEALRVIGAVERQFPLKILMKVEHNQGITRFLNTFNPQLADTVIPLRGPETLLKVRESLEAGYLIGTLGDRIAESDKITHCQFLGKEAAFPAGPMLLAALMHCPVILFFGLYRGGNRYELYFERFADAVTIRRSQREADVQNWTQRYVDRLEYYTRSAPYNWFNFYDYWGEQP